MQYNESEIICSESRVLYLDRVLRSILAANRLISREKNKDKLLQGTCDILFKVREYRMVWIGIIEEDSKKVIPVAHAGFEEGYSETAIITCDDSLTGQGPTGTAIKRRKPSIMRDIISDPQYEPWRKYALERGYRSSAAIPLIFNITVYGTLNVYSTEPNAFDTEEIKLLTQVCDDIAFALNAINEENKRREAEEALKESEEKYRKLFNNEIDAVCIFDSKNRKILDVNDSYLKLYGYTKDEVLQLTTDDISAEPEETQKAINKSLLTGDLIVPVRNHKKKDGTIFQVEISAGPFTLKGKDVMFAIARDITERNRSEEALKESEEKFRSLAEKSPNMIFINKNGRIVFVNEKCEEIMGYKRDEFYSHNFNFMDLIAPESAELVKSNFIKHTKNEDIDPYEFTLINKSGKRIEVINATKIIRYEGEKAILGVINDITKYKQTEEALRKSEEIMRLTIENAPLGIGIIDLNGRFQSVNQSYCDMLGYTANELLNKTFNDITHPEDREKCLRRFTELIKGRLSCIKYKKRNIHKNGSIVNIIQRGAVVRDSHDAPLFVIGISEDITERKRMEEELLRVQKIESIGVLAGGIAHDFNNILTGILGNIALAKMYLNPKEKSYGRLVEAEKASLRARDLTHQLLTFSKGGAPITKTTTIGRLIRDSAAFSLRRSNVTCSFLIPNDLWLVDIDEGQISQVINNLIINANHAMPEGGMIQVICENDTISTKDALPLKEGKYLKITVKDQGIGIPGKHLLKIFDPYFTTKQKGSGLGLAICFSIIKNHKGHITVESDVGVGTTFTIYIPALEKGFLKEQEKKESLLRGTGKILLMDDEEFVRNVAGEMLNSLGYEVVFAQDGKEVIELYKTNKERGQNFEVVIIDLTIAGGMGGKETIKKLIEVDSDVKAIVSSGYSNDPIMADFKKYGFKGVVAKPYKIEELSEVLQKVKYFL